MCVGPVSGAASGWTRFACGDLLVAGRRGAVNILLYWVFFVTMLALMASGGLMYFGYFAGYDVATLHWYATWVVLGFSGLHVLSHLRIGGTSQLLRIFRPTGLSAPPPQLDAIELLTMLAEQ